MNAHSPLSALGLDTLSQLTVGGDLNITINIEGDVFIAPEPEPRAETFPDVFYVSSNGDAVLGALPMILMFGEEDFGPTVPSYGHDDDEAIDPLEILKGMAEIAERASTDPMGMFATSFVSSHIAEPPKVKPTPGRIVHYRPNAFELAGAGSKITKVWAALVTGVFEVGNGEPVVSLLAFPPGRQPLVIEECVHEGDENTERTWFWPARV
jgi:hypothetical protein